jgi:hypothetical protein
MTPIRGADGKFTGSTRSSLRRNAEIRLAAGEMSPEEEARYLTFRKAAQKAHKTRAVLGTLRPSGMTAEQIAWANENRGHSDAEMIKLFEREGVRHRIWY